MTAIPLATIGDAYEHPADRRGAGRHAFPTDDTFDAAGFLSHLAEMDCPARLEGDKIMVSNASRLLAEDRDALKQHRPAIVSALLDAKHACPGACPGIGEDGCNGCPVELPKPKNMDEIDPWGVPTVWTCQRKGEA